MTKSSAFQPRKHLPNLLSLSRVVLGVLFFLLFRRATVAASAVCLGLIVVSMITDYLDGTLARRNNLVSMAGKWIDPLSDFCFFFFVYLAFHTLSLMPLALWLLFLLRELSMYTVVRPLYIRRGLDPAAKLPGKLKTVLQIAGSLTVTLLFLLRHMQILSAGTLRITTLPLLWFMVLTSAVSMYWYIKPLARGPTAAQRTGELKKTALGIVLSAVLPLLLLYAAYSYLVVRLYDVAPRLYLIYLPLHGIFHALIVLGCMVVAAEFRLERDGTGLKRINLPLFLSFARICSVPTLVLLFRVIDQINAAVALVPLLGILFLTDILDGLLARTLDQSSRIGRILDPAGDYVLILAISWVFLIIDFIPIWLFVAVIARLVVQAIGIITLYFLGGYSYLKLSFLGKASVFAVFTIYGIEVLEHLGAPILDQATVILILEIAATGIVAVSLIEKVVSLIRSFRRALGQIGAQREEQRSG